MKTLEEWKAQRRTLTAERDALFVRFLNQPYELKLAHKIKDIDDAVAVCTENEMKLQPPGRGV